MMNHRRLVLLPAAMMLVWLSDCATVPTVPDAEETAILRLSLEAPGRTTAEFSGAPIEAIVELDRDTVFDALYWQTGSGDPPWYPDSFIGKTARRFSVQLTWSRYPSVKDSVDSNYWETVWVNMGGGLKKSNKVRIKVTNLPVVFDSTRFDSVLFSGPDPVWNCELPAPLKPWYQLAVYARDLDRKPVSLQVLGTTGRITRADLTSLTMKYEPPLTDFTDTIILIASDQMRGKAMRKLVVRYRSPNILPVIDSIRVGSMVLGAVALTGSMYRAAFLKIDTLSLSLFARDSLGSIRTVRWNSRHNQLISDTSKPFLATFVCTSSACKGTAADTSVLVDTIRVAVIDDRGDSTVRFIQLWRGTLNQPPAVASITLDADVLPLSDTVIATAVSGGEQHLIRISVADPEKKKLSVAWTGNPSTRFTEKTDSSVRYTAPAVKDTDTIRVTASDGAITVGYTILLRIGDIVPQFDSITIADTVLKGADTILTVEVSPRDTLQLFTFARDRDASDTMTCSWSSGKTARFILRNGFRARYVLPDMGLNDTIIFKLKDGIWELTRKIYVMQANQPPVVDSLKKGTARLAQSGTFYLDTAATGDTINYQAFARDPEGGTLTFLWTAADTASFVSRVSTSASYRCGTKPSVDTLFLRVSDSRGASVLRRILLRITSAVKP